MKINKHNKIEITSEEENAYYNILTIEDELNKIQGGLPNNYNGIVDELQSIRLLISKIGLLVLHEENETSRKRKEVLNKGGEHEIDGVFETTSKSLRFREYSYNSLLFLIHLNLEKYLVILCDFIKSTPLKKGTLVNKFPTSEFENITHFYKYLNEQINLQNDEELFPTKTIYSEIRNALYHRNGYTDKEYASKWINARNDIKISGKKLVIQKPKKSDENLTRTVEFHYIKITNSSFLISYINDVENYFNGLFKLIRNKYDKAYSNGELEM